MPSEAIGACGSGQWPDREAISAELTFGIACLRRRCGKEPSGTSLEILWTDHDSGPYATITLLWEQGSLFEKHWEYIDRCRRTLDQIDEGVDWEALHRMRRSSTDPTPATTREIGKSASGITSRPSAQDAWVPCQALRLRLRQDLPWAAILVLVCLGIGVWVATEKQTLQPLIVGALSSVGIVLLWIVNGLRPGLGRAIEASIQGLYGLFLSALLVGLIVATVYGMVTAIRGRGFGPLLEVLTPVGLLVLFWGVITLPAWLRLGRRKR